MPRVTHVPRTRAPNKQSFLVLCLRILTPARPDSAPAHHRRCELDAVLSSRERSPSKQRHASAWLPPRVTRLERETHDLLTACRKAGRDMRYAARWNDEDCSYGRTPEKQPRRRSGERRRIPKESNSYGGSFWTGMACTTLPAYLEPNAGMSNLTGQVKSNRTGLQSICRRNILKDQELRWPSNLYWPKRTESTAVDEACFRDHRPYLTRAARKLTQKGHLAPS